MTDQTPSPKIIRYYHVDDVTSDAGLCQACYDTLTADEQADYRYCELVSAAACHGCDQK